MVSIATMGKFLPQMGYGYGGAMKYQHPPETEEKPRMKIKVKSIETKDRKPEHLKIIIKCSNNLGVLG